MESLIHNDYRQQPIASDEACAQYRAYLARLEAMMLDQEGSVLRSRAAKDTTKLANARTSLWRLLTKRQGIVDALAAYEPDEQAKRSA